MNMTAAGIDPTKVGLKKYVNGSLPLEPYHRHKNADYNIECKLFGRPYDEWAFGANTDVLDLIWSGKEIKQIISEHLPLYKYDPGVDEGGYLLAPSKWKRWLEKGINYYMRNPSAA